MLRRSVLVIDNPNTSRPAPGALYDVFPAAEAKRLADKLETYHTRKHGNWLYIAEIEPRVLSRQCLEGRVPDAPALQREAQARQDRRDASVHTADWRFTTENARIKLKRLYPSLQE